jgi:surface carbohydrate biosynthesis protein
MELENKRLKGITSRKIYSRSEEAISMKKHRNILYLPIEIQSRELHARVALANIMLRSEFDIVIGEFNQVVNFALKRQGGVLFYKAHSDHVMIKKLIPLKRRGVKIVALDEEGLIYPNDEWYISQRLGSGEYLNQLDAIFTWGAVQRDLIAKLNPDVKHKIHVTGNERLYHRNPAKIGKTILVNTNFGPGNITKTLKMSYIEMVRKQRAFTSESDDIFLKQRQDYYLRLTRYYLDFLKKLDEKIRSNKLDFNIVLRPHPIEDKYTWISELRGTNIKIETLKPSEDFFDDCYCLIHTGCTTALEAYFRNLRVLRYNPMVDERETQESALPNLVSREIKNVDDVFSRVSDDRTNTTSIEHMIKPYLDLSPVTPAMKQAAIIDSLHRSIHEENDLTYSTVSELFFCAKTLAKNTLLLPIMSPFLKVNYLRQLNARSHRWRYLAKYQISALFDQKVSVREVASQVFHVKCV